MQLDCTIHKPLALLLQVAKCYDFFKMRLQYLDLEKVVRDMKNVFVSSIEGKSKTLRFEEILRRVCRTYYNKDTLCTVQLPLDSCGFSVVENSPLKGNEPPTHCGCYAEEIDEEVLCFYDFKDAASKDELHRKFLLQEDAAKHKSVAAKPKSSRRLVWMESADAKTAYSLSMFMWTATHMLLKRLAVVGRHKEEKQTETLTVEKVRELTR